MRARLAWTLDMFALACVMTLTPAVVYQAKHERHPDNAFFDLVRRFAAETKESAMAISDGSPERSAARPDIAAPLRSRAPSDSPNASRVASGGEKRRRSAS